MTKRQAFWIVGSLVGLMVLAPLIAGEMVGIGPEARALPARLAKAESFGLDPGLRRRAAADLAKPRALRDAFDRLQTFLTGKDRFKLPKAAGITPPISSSQAAPPPPRSLPAASVLAPFRTDLRELGRLARAAHGGSHYAWEKSYDLLYPQYAPLKEAARTADTVARLDAHLGDWTAATQDLLDAGAPWATYGDQPSIIGEYTRCAAFSALFRSCGALLSRSAYPAAEARRLGELAAGPQFDQTVSFGDIVLVEASAQFAILEDPKWVRTLQTEFTGDGTRDLAFAAKLPQVRTAWQSDLLRNLNEAYPALPRDRYDFVGQKRVAQDYETAVDRSRGILGRFAQVAGGVYYAPLIDVQRKREAQRRVLLLATGLRAGEPEAALRRRLGPLAIDPYDGKPLRVGRALEVPYWLNAYLPGIIERDLRVVYSVGPDGTDNGGQTAKRGTDPIDITLPISSAPIAR